ncbi:MAG: hypothetical protein O7B35_07975 [Deltaproteobacteria bacterium]|nr:hypothetical protein [Deltaproteobacteria bacterium]
MVRYYGVYGNVSRGKRKKEEQKKNVIGKPEFVEVPPPLVSFDNHLLLPAFVVSYAELNHVLPPDDLSCHALPSSHSDTPS